ncbi:MAG: hypothetical protein IKK34_04180 [Clostridia bacterium]|nr:hypothetical protein [Clostridia bacterium]
MLIPLAFPATYFIFLVALPVRLLLRTFKLQLRRLVRRKTQLFSFYNNSTAYVRSRGRKSLLSAASFHMQVLTLPAIDNQLRLYACVRQSASHFILMQLEIPAHSALSVFQHKAFRHANTSPQNYAGFKLALQADSQYNKLIILF